MKAQRASLWAVLRQLLPALAVCALFAAAGILHAGGRLLVVRAGYKLSDLQAENRVLTRENDRLRLELATLKGPGRLEQVARGELGMAPPSANQVITMTPAPRLGRTSPKGTPR